MLTEADARKKWCPYARRLEEWSERTSYNRCKDDTPGSMCIASECMAWAAAFDANGKRTGFGRCGLVLS